jgi:hypothetical protein
VLAMMMSGEMTHMGIAMLMMMDSFCKHQDKPLSTMPAESAATSADLSCCIVPAWTEATGHGLLALLELASCLSNCACKSHPVSQLVKAHTCRYPARPATGSSCLARHYLFLQLKWCYFCVTFLLLTCRYPARPSKASYREQLFGEALYGVAPILAALQAGEQHALPGMWQQHGRQQQQQQ